MDIGELIKLIISFLLGGLMSLLIWLLTTKILSPRILLADDLSRVNTNQEGKKRYFFKIQNLSPQRNIYDIACYVRYHFSDDSFYSETLPTIPLLKHREAGYDYKYERKIELKRINLANVNKSIQERYGKENNQIEIDEFFEKENNNGYIEMIVICYDAFSGAKRCVISKEFRQSNINDGHYLKGSMKIEPEPNPNSSIESHADTYH